MTNIQPTMENFNNNNSKGTLDLRPEGHQAETEAAQAKKQELLAQQTAASSDLPKGMDIKPAPSKGFNQVPGINSQATGEANVFTLSTSELENPPAGSGQNETPPQATEAQFNQASVDVRDAAGQTETTSTPPAKKPGFFGKLFGKK